MLNNWVVAKSKCLWHVKDDEKHHCICWIPKLEWWCSWKRKKKSTLVLTFLLHVWVLSFFSVPVETFCNCTTARSGFYLPYLCHPCRGQLWSRSHTQSVTAVQTYHFFLLLQKAGQREQDGLCTLANTVIASLTLFKIRAAASFLSSWGIPMPL